MYRNKTVLAVITARGSSKRLPGKNVKMFAGKPLIAWTIETAKRNRHVDKVIVSTDSKKIAGISGKYGAEIPFLRPKRLARDGSRSVNTVLHTLEWIKVKRRTSYDLIVMLQPTSPLRISGDIDRALELLFTRKAKCVVSVCKSEHPPFWLGRLSETGCMKNFLKPGIEDGPSQGLGIFYRINGAIYIAYADYIKKKKSFFGDKTFAYIMPEERSVDIDSKLDFKVAEILKNRKGY